MSLVDQGSKEVAVERFHLEIAILTMALQEHGRIVEREQKRLARLKSRGNANPLYVQNARNGLHDLDKIKAEIERRWKIEADALRELLGETTPQAGAK